MPMDYGSIDIRVNEFTLISSFTLLSMMVRSSLMPCPFAKGRGTRLGPKEKFDHFEGKQKGGKIFETREAMPTKIDLHAFFVNVYLHEFFEPMESL